jgi:hypothetical protein
VQLDSVLDLAQPLAAKIEPVEDPYRLAALEELAAEDRADVTTTSDDQDNSHL